MDNCEYAGNQFFVECQFSDNACWDFCDMVSKVTINPEELPNFLWERKGYMLIWYIW